MDKIATKQALNAVAQALNNKAEELNNKVEELNDKIGSISSLKIPISIIENNYDYTAQGSGLDSLASVLEVTEQEVTDFVSGKYAAATAPVVDSSEAYDIVGWGMCSIKYVRLSEGDDVVAYMEIPLYDKVLNGYNSFSIIISYNFSDTTWTVHFD